MESTISTYYTPQMKINYSSDYCPPSVINKPIGQFNAFNSANPYSPNHCNPNSFNQPNSFSQPNSLNQASYVSPRLDDQHNLKGFNLSNQPKMVAPPRNQSSTLQRSHLKPTSGSIAQHANQLNGQPTNSARSTGHPSNLTNTQPPTAAGQPTGNHQATNRTNRREIPRLPNAVIMNKLTSNSSQASSLNSSTVSSSTLSANQNVQRNALQSPAFGECCLSFLPSLLTFSCSAASSSEHFYCS